MRIHFIIKTFGLGLIVSNIVEASVPLCKIQDMRSPQTPKCPLNGRMLDASFPIQTLSISDIAQGKDFVIRVVEDLMQAQVDPLPLVLLNGQAETLKALDQHLRSQSWYRPQMSDNLVLVSAEGFDDDTNSEVEVELNWQQDFYQGEFDPKTGSSMIRLYDGYPSIGNLSEKTVEAVRVCEIPQAPSLKPRLSFDGASGGNSMMVLPGLCVVGDSDISAQDFSEISKAECGQDSFVIKAPSFWSRSQHIDEFFSAVPIQSENSCEVLLMFASPKRGIDLLSQLSKEAFFDWQGRSELDFDFLASANTGMATLCGSHQEQNFDRTHNIVVSNPKIEMSLNGKERLSYPLSTSYLAGSGSVTGQGLCASLKNGEALETLREDKTLWKFNLLAQREIDNFEGSVKAQIMTQFPNCKIKSAHFPSLFTGQINVTRDPVLENGSSHSGYSIFPNPTNLVIVGKTLMIPEPYNESFKQDILNQLKPYDFKINFVDTLVMHEGFGDLHCATQVLRYCRP